MEPDERAVPRKRLVKVITEARHKVASNLYEQKVKFAENYRLTIKDLSLISGTLAGASLILLSVDIPRVTALVVIGIFLLLIEIAYSYFYLFSAIDADSQELKNLKSSFLDPTSEIVRIYRDAENSNMTWAEFDEKAKPIVDKLRAESGTIWNSKETDKDFRTDKKGWVGFSLFATGLFFLVIGLSLPYITSNNQIGHRQKHHEQRQIFYYSR